MTSKTIVITGTTSGIGATTTIALAKQGHTVYMLVRNVEKGERVQREVLVQTRNKNIHIIECDLSNMASVHHAVQELKSKLTEIHVLINNAGGMFSQRETSADGFEMTFALNHLGHFLLTLSLMPLLEKGQARIINLSSDAHKAARLNFDDLQMEKGYNAIKAYGTAKLFNIYFTQLLAQKCANKGITAYSLHPGIVDTNFGKHSTGLSGFLLKVMRPFMITAENAAETPVYLATEPGIEHLSGSYFKQKKVAKPSALANNPQAREQLWTISEQLVKAYL